MALDIYYVMSELSDKGDAGLALDKLKLGGRSNLFSSNNLGVSPSEVLNMSKACIQSIPKTDDKVSILLSNKPPFSMLSKWNL